MCRDIFEQHGDFSLPRFPDAERENVIPTSQFGGPVFKAYRLAGQSYLTVNLKPVIFVMRDNPAYSSAPGVLNTRLLLKRRIDFQETVINGMIAFVEQHFDGAKAFVDRIEQCAVF